MTTHLAQIIVRVLRQKKSIPTFVTETMREGCSLYAQVSTPRQAENDLPIPDYFRSWRS